MSTSHSLPDGPMRFGVFELDPRTGELRKHGVRVKLQDRPLHVLQVLLEEPGQMVSREDLQRRLWPSGTFVEFDKGIYNAIKRLREALGDTAETPRFIETLPKRGYRFIGSINRANGQGHPAPVEIESFSTRVRRAWPFALVVLTMAVVAIFTMRDWRAPHKDRSLSRELKFTQLTDGSVEEPITYVALSPDGRLIAYADALGIHVKEIDTGEVKSFPPPADPQPPAQGVPDARLPISWFPDGTRLLANTKPGPIMWSISLLTGKAQKLGEDGWASSVSPDGSLIAFIKNESEIWLMGSRGDQPKRVALAEPGDTFERVLWSPDARGIVYVTIHHRPDVIECSIETRILQGGPTTPTPIISDPQLCQEQPVAFWAADDRIVFSLREALGEGSNLWSVRVNRQTGRRVSSPARLTNWPQTFVNGITGSADGRRLVFRRALFRNLTYLKELTSAASPGTQPPHLLLPANAAAWPTAWTSDSRAIVFYRMNGGNTDIFKQDIDKDTPELLLKTPGEQLTPRLSPDGSSFIYMYVPSYERFGAGSPVRLMRIPAAGGPSELILTSTGYVGHRCARVPTRPCVLGELSPDRRSLIFYSFDPLRGPSSAAIPENKQHLFSIQIDPDREPDWDISPDGSLLALSGLDEHEIPIRFIALDSGPNFEVTVKGWGNRHSMFWSPDGRSLFISSHSTSDETLLQVDLQGHAIPLYQQKGAYGVWGVPSPDGRYLAILSLAKEPDLWLAENL